MTHNSSNVFHSKRQSDLNNMKSTAYDSSLNNDLLNLAKSSKNLPKNTNSGAVTITEENEILKLPKR